MTDHISITGVIATQPRSIVTSEGLAICSFRVASPQRHFSKSDNQWVEGETNWFTVSAFRQLAEHATSSLHKGERIVVRGRLKLRQWEREEKTGVSVEIEADALGHDLRWGSSSFTRSDTHENSALEKESAHQEDLEKVPF